MILDRLFASPLQVSLYSSPSSSPLAEFLPDLPDLPSFPILDFSDPLVTGVVFYVSSLFFLTAWEKWIVPTLKLDSILPSSTLLLPGDLTKRERESPFVTPLTSRMSTPPPDLETLVKERKYLVGKVGSVRHFITCEKRDVVKGCSGVSEEWSEYYGEEIYVYKEREK